jgi:aspartyl-tRNA(Asn)/glutamyl-tRNA(Gln) amidotransferase subunit C
VKLSREQVEHIADLARLALSEDEVAMYQEQLSAILEHFDHLQ